MTEQPVPAPRVRVLVFAVAAVIIAADQITKIWAVAVLEPGGTTPVIDGVLHWTLRRNPGSAFGLFARWPVVFTILASVISIGIVVMAGRAYDRLNASALGLVLGGAAGNLVDRFARAPAVGRGHVVDFIDLRVWPVFNIADAAIVVGAALLVVASYRAERREKAASRAG